jgi:hypothetical protein
MKPQNHAHEDRLLDFVYGELPPQEAQAVQSHLDGCSRCSEQLAGIRGVRTTMAQLPMESAPDAGLESLLAYAQQAARNAAAGPAPKPTWWRRWLVPAMGVTAVGLFGVVSVTVSKTMDLKAEVEAQSVQQKSADAAAPASPEPRPAESYREPSTAGAPAAMKMEAPKNQMVPPSPVASPSSALGAAQAQEEMRGGMQGITPPPPAPAAKLDSSSMEKQVPRKKPFMAGAKGSRSEWSNAGTGPGFGDTKDAPRAAAEEGMAYEAPSERKSKKSYDRRDAKEALPQQPSTPAAAQAPMMEEAPASDGVVAENEAEVQQQAPSRGSLRVGGGRSSDAAANRPSTADSADDDFDDLFGGKSPRAKREQSAPSAPPPPLPTASAKPMPSPSTGKSRAPSKTAARAEPSGGSSEPSAAELSQLAQDALRSDNRVLEAQFLRQALAAGATGQERLGLLNRLCDAEFAMGRRQEAFEACALVLEEAPRSSAAQMARSRLRKEGLEADDAKAGTGSRGPVKAAPADKMEAPASAPAYRQ